MKPRAQKPDTLASSAKKLVVASDKLAAATGANKVRVRVTVAEFLTMASNASTLLDFAGATFGPSWPGFRSEIIKALVAQEKRDKRRKS